MSDLSLVPCTGRSSSSSTSSSSSSVNSSNDVTEMRQQYQPHPLFGMGGHSQQGQPHNPQPQPPQYHYQNSSNVNHYHGSNYSFHFNTAGVYDVHLGVQDFGLNNNAYRYGGMPTWGDNLNRQQQQQGQPFHQQSYQHGGMFGGPSFNRSPPLIQQSAFYPQQSGFPMSTQTQGPSGTRIRPTDLSPPPSASASGYNKHRR